MFMPLVAASNMAFGDVCRINTSGTAALVDANAVATSAGLAMCAQAQLSGTVSGTFLLFGSAHDETWNWTLGGLTYISCSGTTGYTMTQTAPAGLDDVIQIVGVALGAKYMFFTPQLVMVEHT
jgi:hypothetical protein